MPDPRFNIPFVKNPFGFTKILRGNAAITFADIDGDGDLDAFIGGYNGTRFYRNTGNASAANFIEQGANYFPPANDYSSNPTFADIDGDGDLDAFVGNVYGDIVLYRNTGTASNAVFTTTGRLILSTDIHASPCFADIDGDGDFDVFVGNKTGDTLFFRNVGNANDAIFAAPLTNPFELTNVGSYAKPTFVDVDGNGLLDVFIGNRDGNTLFYRNTGTASNPVFAAPVTNPFGLVNINSTVGKSSLGLWIRPSFLDIDGDGDLDVFISETMGNTLFFLNNQAGVHISQTASTASVAEAGATEAYTVVLNSAPTADVVISLTTDHQVSGSVSSLTFTTANWNMPQTVTVTAVNDTVIEGSHNGMIQHTATSSDADYNNIVIANVNVAITDNDFHDPAFNSPLLNAFGLSHIGYSAIAPIFADIDADGDLDLFEGVGIGSIEFFRNTGKADNPQFELDTGGSVNKTPFGLTNVGLYSRPSLVDIDGDGDLDAFIGNAKGETVFFRNTGSASNASFVAEDSSVDKNPFGLTIVEGDPTSGGHASPTFADIDADGDLDAFVGNYDGYTLFFRNTGSASNAAFVAETGGSVDGNPFGLIKATSGFDSGWASPVFADFDRDGDLDVLIGVTGGDTWFFRNTGTKSDPAFATPVKNPFGLTNVREKVGLSVGDINGDGELDVIIGNHHGNTKIYIHNHEHTGKVIISGVVQQAEVLTASNTLADANGLGVIHYQWQANGVDIAGAKNSTYNLSGTELDKVISVTAIYTDGSGVTEKETSVATAPVAENFTNFTIYGDKGGTRPDTLEGASGNDALYGLTDNDVLLGGKGNDKLYGFYGFDSLYGGDGNDKLYGEQDDDYLDGGKGNDTLDGGFGVDTMIGGEGNDTYYLGYDEVDVITDNGLATDIDTVIMPYQLSVYTLPAGIENGTISAGTQAASLEGNDGNNVLTGNAGKNTLKGGGGKNTLSGGLGDDTLIGGLEGDRVNGGKGNDTIFLDAENSQPASTALNGNPKGAGSSSSSSSNRNYGNAGPGNDTIIGSSSIDVIDGNIGSDILTGKEGADIFKFSTEPNSSNIDTIIDFTIGIDKINLSEKVFNALDKTTLAPGVFLSGNGAENALDNNDYLIYNTANGKLYYDADGSGIEALPIQIALLGTTTHPVLTSSDFYVV